MSLHRIVQRHVNALALANYLSLNATDGLRLTCEWFFTEPTGPASAQVDRFCAWLEGSACDEEHLVRGVRWVVARSPLDSSEPQRILRFSEDILRKVAEEWRTEHQRICEALEQAGGENEKRAT